MKTNEKLIIKKKQCIKKMGKMKIKLKMTKGEEKNNKEKNNTEENTNNKQGE